MDMYDTYTGITWYHGLVCGLHVSCSAVPYAVWRPHLSERWHANQRSLIFPRLGRSCPTCIPYADALSRINQYLETRSYT